MLFAELSVVKDQKLKSLYLRWNNLSSVPTDILVGGISGLEVVILWETDLTTEQLMGIYRMMAGRRCSRLRKISLVRNDLSSVSQELCDREKLNQSVRIIQ